MQSHVVVRDTTDTTYAFYEEKTKETKKKKCVVPRLLKMWQDNTEYVNKENLSDKIR